MVKDVIYMKLKVNNGTEEYDFKYGVVSFIILIRLL